MRSFRLVCTILARAKRAYRAMAPPVTHSRGGRFHSPSDYAAGRRQAQSGWGVRLVPLYLKEREGIARVSNSRRDVVQVPHQDIRVAVPIFAGQPLRDKRWPAVYEDAEQPTVSISVARFLKVSPITLQYRSVRSCPNPRRIIEVRFGSIERKEKTVAIESGKLTRRILRDCSVTKCGVRWPGTTYRGEEQATRILARLMARKSVCE